MNNQYALVVFSGGMDSTTALLWARREFSGISAVSFSYGSKHKARELAAANTICRKLNVPRLEIPLDFIGKYFHSSLLKTGGSIPEGAYDEVKAGKPARFETMLLNVVNGALKKARDTTQAEMAKLMQANGMDGLFGGK